MVMHFSCILSVNVSLYLSPAGFSRGCQLHYAQLTFTHLIICFTLTISRFNTSQGLCCVLHRARSPGLQWKQSALRDFSMLGKQACDAANCHTKTHTHTHRC